MLDYLRSLLIKITYSDLFGTLENRCVKLYLSRIHILFVLLNKGIGTALIQRCYNRNTKIL